MQSDRERQRQTGRDSQRGVPGMGGQKFLQMGAWPWSLAKMQGEGERVRHTHKEKGMHDMQHQSKCIQTGREREREWCPWHSSCNMNTVVVCHMMCQASLAASSNQKVGGSNPIWKPI